MKGHREALRAVAMSISAGEAVDWDSAQSGASDPAERELIASLRAVMDIAWRSAEGVQVGEDRNEAQEAEESPVAAGESARRASGGGTEPSERWGPLEIRELVGQGSFGLVYRALDTTLKREVALKMLRPEVDVAPDGSLSQVSTFVLEEGQHLARVRHPNVVTVYGAGEHDGRIGLWMEYIHGHTLEDLLQILGRFGAREAALIGLDLCRALSAVHGAGLVHRDVKAKNVMQEEGGRVVLMDFGAGREMHADTESRASTIAGTPVYMAPEVLRGESPTPRSDIYSLGTLLFRLLTHRYPYEADSVMQLRQVHERSEANLLGDLRPGLPEAIVRVVEGALAADPAARFSSAGQMERALEAALNLVTRPVAPGRLRSLPRRLFRRRGTIAAAAIGVAATLAVAVGIGRSGWFRGILPGRPRAEAGWIATGTPLCTSASERSNAKIAAAGEEGAVLVWQDLRNGDFDLFGQRVDRNGRVQWGPNGVGVCTAVGSQLFRNDNAIQLVPALVCDPTGGAIVVWYDQRGKQSDIYAQHLTVSGAIASSWPVDGLRVSGVEGYLVDPVIVSDGSGGAIIAWRGALGDSAGHVYDLYAQHVTAGGQRAPGWPAAGLPVCTALGDQQALNLVSDGDGGAVITWCDFRSGMASVYAERVVASGSIAPGWPRDGVRLCTAVGEQGAPIAVADGAGGAIVTWEDRRSGEFDIFAQHVTAAGKLAVGWDPSGVGICVYNTHNQCLPAIIADGAGGAIITWFDWRHFCQAGRTCADIFAQRVDGAGAVQWTTNGVAVCSVPGDEANPCLTADGTGGAIIAWQDCRNVSPPLSDIPGAGVIYAQRIDASGRSLWAANGVPISTAPGPEVLPMIAADGMGGAYITWQDGRNGKKDVYVGHVTESGAVGAARHGS